MECQPDPHLSLPAGATAVYNSSGSLQYYRHADWLSSVRLVSTPSRTVSGDTAYAPFRYPYAQSGSPALSFTGQNQDTGSNLYDFMYREYGIQGRWPSPDPLDTGAFNLADPQSLDLYSYVRNSPMSLVDPLGLCTGGQVSTPNGGCQCPSGTAWNANVQQCSGTTVVVTGTVGGMSVWQMLQQWGGPFDLGPVPMVYRPGVLHMGGGFFGTPPAAAPQTPSWWGTFAKNFFGNFVSLDFYKSEFSNNGCLSTFVSASADALNPASPSLAGAGGAGTMAVSTAMRYNAAQAYAASRTNVLRGQGLIFPQKSIPYNDILEGSTVTNLAEGGLGYVDGAVFQGLVTEAQSAFNGTCH